MIKQQIFALEMDALTSRLQRLQLDNKIVTLLHELWDKMKIGGRRKVEIITNEDGMEVITGFQHGSNILFYKREEILASTLLYYKVIVKK